MKKSKIDLKKDIFILYGNNIIKDKDKIDIRIVRTSYEDIYLKEKVYLLPDNNGELKPFVMVNNKNEIFDGEFEYYKMGDKNFIKVHNNNRFIYQHNYIELDNKTFIKNNKNKLSNGNYNYSELEIEVHTNGYGQQGEIYLFQGTYIIIDENSHLKFNHSVYDNKNKLEIYKDILLKKQYSLHSKFLCRISRHPKCCAINILSHFTEEIIESHLTKKHIELFKRFLFSTRTPKVAHLSSEQPASKEFLEEMGFELIYEFVNPNSNNTIYELFFNPTKKEFKI